MKKGSTCVGFHTQVLLEVMNAMVCTRPDLDHADSNYGGDLLKRRSRMCYIFTLFGCDISWKLTLQDTVALSTTESEYMSLMEGIKEEIWFQGLIQSLGLKVEKPILYCDSQNALSLAKSPMYHEKTKHINLMHNFIWIFWKETSFQY